VTNADDRRRVRVTQDVGEIFGVDGEEYFLQEGEVITLPALNAEPLLDKDAAVRVNEPEPGEIGCGAELFMGGGGDDNPYEAPYEEQEQRRRDAKAPEATGYARPASMLPVGQLEAMSPTDTGGCNDLPVSARTASALTGKRLQPSV